MPIKDYSTTPASNISLFPEGMNPADVNNSARQLQADTRSWYNTPQWRDLGNVPTRVTASSFTVVGDQTAIYPVGMRIRVIDNANVFYGTITASSYSAPNTTITAPLDNASVMTVNLTALAAGLDPSNAPIPPAALGTNPTFPGNVNAVTITTTGAASSGAFNPTSTGIPTNGLYLPAAGNPAISVAGVKHQDWTQTISTFVGVDNNDANFVINKPGAGTGSPGVYLQKNGANSVAMYNSGTDYTFVNYSTSGGINFFTNNGAALPLVLTAAGNATFSGTLTGSSFVPTAAAGVVGMLMLAKGASADYNATVAGSSLTPCDAGGNETGSAQTGTWRQLGRTLGSSSRVSLYQRIS